MQKYLNKYIKYTNYRSQDNVPRNFSVMIPNSYPPTPKSKYIGPNTLEPTIIQRCGCCLMHLSNSCSTQYPVMFYIRLTTSYKITI